ncbi:NAD(P)-binding protein [Leucogyrophana mollusca]|uniref:NAD(P)-binding protein n=1 Tax=Leucogyrophana mollusca TaxID=85980 RepID=A0ACB8B4A9_9AGAM|nr:NAD(P)-binding protein [Leucogyrophana mollusca]
MSYIMHIITSTPVNSDPLQNIFHMASSSPKVWFITGASSGFGRAMTQLLLEKGDKVVATLRRPEVISDLRAKFSSDRLLIIKLDVTKPNEIQGAFLKAKEAFGRIDVVFNNAGFSAVAEVEGTSSEVARALFETNFWGAVNVTTEAVKFFREVNKPVGGRLLQMSSMVGLTAAPGLGYYSATKFALEAISESLAQELDPKWNIKASIEPAHPAYADQSLPAQQQRKWFSSNEIDGDISKAVVVMEKLAHLDEPPVRIPLHRLSILLARRKAERVQKETDEYELWSEDVYFG